MERNRKRPLIFVYDLSLSNKNESERNRIKRKFYYHLNRILKEGQGYFITESAFSISPDLKSEVLNLFSETEGASAFMIEAKDIRLIR